MIGDKQGKIGVLGITGRIFIAVPVHGDDAIGIFTDHHTMRIHAERAYAILKFLGAVDDLAFV